MLLQAYRRLKTTDHHFEKDFLKINTNFICNNEWRKKSEILSKIYWHPYVWNVYPVLTITFPWDFPSNCSMKVFGRFSKPSTMCSYGFNLPCRHLEGHIQQGGVLRSKFKMSTQKLSFMSTENDLGVKVDIEDCSMLKFHICWFILVYVFKL